MDKEKYEDWLEKSGIDPVQVWTKGYLDTSEVSEYRALIVE